MEKEFHFTKQDLLDNGWDGNLDSLDEFKEQLKSMLELGWDPKEMTMQEFALRMASKLCGVLVEPTPQLESENDDEDDDSESEDKKDDYEDRRTRAEEAGWDEEEMSLEEFEDYFM